MIIIIGTENILIMIIFINTVKIKFIARVLCVLKKQEIKEREDIEMEIIPEVYIIKHQI